MLNDVFGVIDDLIADVRAGDIATITTSGLQRVHDATGRLTEALGSVGANGNLVVNALSTGQARQDELRTYRSSIVDMDLAEAAIEVTAAETAYEAVLAATARLQLPNLADYLS